MENTTAVTGRHTTDGRPNSVTAITPFLALRDARAAQDFYVAHLGATLISSTEFPGEDGPVVAHAELDFEGARLQVGEADAAYGTRAPSADGTVDYSLALYVRDVDEVAADLAAHGAAVREEPSTFVSGDRFASVIDPFHVRWSLMTRVEDLSDEESAARVAAWAAAQG